MAFKIVKNETENKTVRFPLDLIERINEVVIKEDTNFSRFVINACEYALANMEKEEEDK